MRRVFGRARTGMLVLSAALGLVPGVAAQQRATRNFWTQRPPRPQTAHSRLFLQRMERAQPTGLAQHVMVISVDGMMPETYLHPDAHGLKIPTLREMIRQGAYSEGALGVFPAVTFPSHTSMVTGVTPGAHGILSNHPFDPLGKMPGAWRWYTEDIRVPTLWSVARAKGLKTALVSWPVTVGARATAVVPEFARQNDGTPEDAKMNFALSTPGLLETVAKRFPDFRAQFVPPRTTDESLTDIAVHLIETQQPNLLLLHIFDVDHFQHDDGPLAGRGLAALEGADLQIARVIAAVKKAGIWDQTVVVVVSDHGFAHPTQRVRPGVWLREKGLVTLDDKNKIKDWKAYLHAATGSAYLYVKDKNDLETQRVLLEIFQQTSGKPGTGIGRVFTHEQVVAMGGDPEAFLAVEAAEGWAIAGGVVGDVISPAVGGGEHGYPPDLPAMRASLLLYGPAVGHGKIEGARLIDVGPTVARLLGFKLEKVEGRPLDLPLRRPQAVPATGSGTPR